MQNIAAVGRASAFEDPCRVSVGAITAESSSVQLRITHIPYMYAKLLDVYGEPSLGQCAFKLVDMSLQRRNVSPRWGRVLQSGYQNDVRADSQSMPAGSGRTST